MIPEVLKLTRTQPAASMAELWCGICEVQLIDHTPTVPSTVRSKRVERRGLGCKIIECSTAVEKHGAVHLYVFMQHRGPYHEVWENTSSSLVLSQDLVPSFWNARIVVKHYSFSTSISIFIYVHTCLVCRQIFSPGLAN